MPQVHLDDVQINYLQLETQSESPQSDIVLVHGLATSMAFWYPHIASKFTDTQRVTMFDMRGHGRSSRPESGYGARSMAGDLVRLLDHCEIERAHLIAHSFGGAVSLWLACLHPERVESLMLADTHISFAGNRTLDSSWRRGVRFQEVVNKNGLDLDVRDPAFGYKLLELVAKFQARGEDLPADLHEIVHPFAGAFGRRASSQWLSLMEQTEAKRELLLTDGLTAEDLAGLSLPVLGMYGSESPNIATAEALRGIWPDSRIVSVEGAGHFFPIPRAAEFVDEYLAFHASLESTAAR